MAVLRKERRGRGLGVLVAVVAITAAAVVAAIALVAAVFDPFATEEVDRSGPAVLERMRTLEDFDAAKGTFVQPVDVEQDARWLPDFLKGERVTALVTGSVTATVDFSDLGADSVVVSDDGRSIAVTLPPPTLGKAEIDEGATRVVSRDRGLLDRVSDFFSGNPFDDHDLYVAAQDKLDAAARQTDLAETARRNTERWLKTFLGAAGFENVTVNWSKNPS